MLWCNEIDSVHTQAAITQIAHSLRLGLFNT
jgi:hypothetical protein